jgi:hypothetical protein
MFSTSRIQTTSEKATRIQELDTSFTPAARNITFGPNQSIKILRNARNHAHYTSLFTT